MRSVTSLGAAARCTWCSVLAFLATLCGTGTADATVIDFELPLLATGTILSNQYAANGLTFTPGPDGSPAEGADQGRRAIGPRVAFISANQSGVPDAGPRRHVPSDRRRTTVTVSVRNVTPGAFTSNLRLRARDTSDAVVAESNAGAYTAVPSSPSGWVALTATASSAVIHHFEIIAKPGDDSNDVIVDDISFDDPPPGSPDVLDRHERHRAAARRHVALGPDRPSANRRLDRRRDLSAANLPFHVTATFSPNPVPGTAQTATMTLHAGENAQSFGGARELRHHGHAGPTERRRGCAHRAGERAVSRRRLACPRRRRSGSTSRRARRSIFASRSCGCHVPVGLDVREAFTPSLPAGWLATHSRELAGGDTRDDRAHLAR